MNLLRFLSDSSIPFYQPLIPLNPLDSRVSHILIIKNINFINYLAGGTILACNEYRKEKNEAGYFEVSKIHVEGYLRFHKFLARATFALAECWRGCLAIILSAKVEI